MTGFDPARFRRAFDDVWNQLRSLQTYWTLYFCLYGSRRSVKLLRATAVVTIGALQELLIAAIYWKRIDYSIKRVGTATPEPRRLRASFTSYRRHQPRCADASSNN